MGCEHRHHPQLNKHRTSITKLDPSSVLFVPEIQNRAQNMVTREPNSTNTSHVVSGTSRGPAAMALTGNLALQTVPMTFIGPNGKRLKANAFLDDGSSYITENMANELGLQATKEPFRVSVFGAGQ